MPTHEKYDPNSDLEHIDLAWFDFGFGFGLILEKKNDYFNMMYSKMNNRMLCVVLKWLSKLSRKK